MILYNVTIKLHWDIHAEWLQWMQHEHMPEMVATGFFNHCKLLRLLETDEEEGPTYAAQYFAESKELYDEYIAKSSEAMREKGLKKWGNRFIAFRSVMQVIA
jgi:Domain of unknown function (DUF4286)